ncbi:MAG: hypothetical protein FWF90_16465, partial [Promicromonosporaceae bacterium]|nr:hypothetical protein [Promicromonosporaceae bacterium]
MLGRPVQTAHRAELTQSLREAAGPVGRDPRGLTHDVDAPTTPHGGLRVLVRKLRVDVKQTPSHHQVLADTLSILLRETPKALACVLRKLTERDVLGDLRLLDPRLEGPLVPTRARVAGRTATVAGATVTTVTPTEATLATVITTEPARRPGGATEATP